MLTFEGLPVGGEGLESLSLGNIAANHRLLLGGEFLHLLFDGCKIGLADLLAVGQEYIVVETILDSRTEAELDAGIELLQRLCKQVCAGVPEGVFSLLIVPFIEHQFSIFSNGAVEFHGLTVHATGQHIGSQTR